VQQQTQQKPALQRQGLCKLLQQALPAPRLPLEGHRKLLNCRRLLCPRRRQLRQLKAQVLLPLEILALAMLGRSLGQQDRLRNLAPN
jgi:hypothetical protein